MNGPLRITLMQTELLWENIEGNLRLLGQELEEVGETDLIVFPEMFTTGFTMDPKALAEEMNGPTVSWMQERATEKGAVVCGSIIVKESGHFHNRFVAAYPDGHLVLYDKKHLFTLAGEDVPYTAGHKRVLFEVNGWKILPLICYDLRFPVWARSQKSGQEAWEYDLLLYVANWPKPRINAWDTLLKARAIENQAYCVGVNRIGTDANGLEYVGHSAVYDFAGEAVLSPWESARQKKVALNKRDMAQFRERLPFQKDGDEFLFQKLE